MRRAAPVIAALALATSSAAQAPGASRPTAATIAAAVDSLATRAMAAGLSSALGVAVVMDGQTIYDRSFGFADATAGVRADSSTLWYIASTTKSYTGLAVALLAEQKVIDIRAPITTLLPRARWHPGAHAEQLTLADFLTHTMGLDAGAVVTNAAYTGNVPEARWPELLAYSEPLPTRDMIYNNLGYNVAAMVIDTKRPEGWRAFIERQILAPAGLRETYFRVSGLDRRRIAMPHDITKERGFATRPFVKTDVTMNSAGGTLATLGDLARWVTVNMSDGVIDGRQVLPAAAMRLAHTQLAAHTRESARRFGPFDRTGWAMGWDIGSYRGEPMVSRFGAYESIRSHLSYLPARRIGVVAQATAASGYGVTDVIASYVYDLEAGRPDALARADSGLAVAKARLDQWPARLAAQDSTVRSRQRPLGRPSGDFAGTYEHPAYGRIVWTVRDGVLHYTLGAYSGPATVYDAAKHQLRIEFGGSGTVATFVFDASGPAREVSLGGNMVFQRVGAGAGPR